MLRSLIAVVVLIACACAPPETPDACMGRMPGDLVITEFLNNPAGTDTGSEWIEIYNTLGTAIELKGITVYTKNIDGTGVRNHVIRAGRAEPRGYFVLGDVRSGANPAYVNYAYGGDLSNLSNTDGIIGLRCGTAITFDEVQHLVTATSNRSRQLDGALTPDAMTNDDETKWCSATQALAGTDNFGTPGQANTVCPLVVPSGNCVDPGGSASRPVVPPLPGQLYFTEVMADPKAVPDTDGEWLELRSTTDVDLNDVVLTVGTTNRVLSSPQCLRVPAGTYAVLAHETDAGVNGGLSNVMATFTQSLGNSGGTVTLKLDEGGDAGFTDLDTATYPASLNGIAWQLDPTRLDSISNDDVSAYCAANVRYGDPDGGDFGTPGAANTTCTAVADPNQCNDNGTMRPVVSPAAGSVYFTEVMADPRAVADSVGEWLELRSDSAADLNGLVLTVGTSARTLSHPNCLAVPAGGYALLAHPNSQDAGLPPTLTTFTQALTNGGGTLTLSYSDAGIIDTTTYPAAVAGVALQLSPATLSAVGNDDQNNYCRATQGYPADGGDLGTPAAPNTTCPAPPNPNDCVDPGSGLMRAIVKPVLGDLVITEFMADPTRVPDTTGEYIELYANNGFDLNGLTLANEGTGMSSVSSQTCLPVDAGTYALFARSLDPLANGGLPQPLATFSFDLANSAGVGARGVHVRSGTTTLDIFSYDSATAGASLQLRPGLTSPDDNEDAGSVCVTPTMRYVLPDGGQGDRGTPGAVNENCP